MGPSPSRRRGAPRWRRDRSGTLLRSRDGGVTWAPVTSGTPADLRSIAIAPDGRTALAVGDRRHAAAQPGWRHDLGAGHLGDAGRPSVHRHGAGRAPRAGGGGSRHAAAQPQDGGMTWAPVTWGTRADLRVHRHRAGRAHRAGGGIGRHAGCAWPPGCRRQRQAAAQPGWRRDLGAGRPLGMQADLLSIAIAPDGRTALAAEGSGTLLRSPDGGVTWAPVTSGTQAYLGSIAIAPDGRTALAAGWEGTLLRSQDGGASWVRSPRGRRPTFCPSPWRRTGAPPWRRDWDVRCCRSQDGGASLGTGRPLSARLATRCLGALDSRFHRVNTRLCPTAVTNNRAGHRRDLRERPPAAERGPGRGGNRRLGQPDCGVSAESAVPSRRSLSPWSVPGAAAKAACCPGSPMICGSTASDLSGSMRGTIRARRTCSRRCCRRSVAMRCRIG